MEKGSSSSSASGVGADSLNALKFGKKVYFEGVASGLRPKTGGGLMPEEAAPPPSPAKKGRTGVVQSGQPPRCQVEGCKVDLSDAKAYYCRHKVCGMHSKSPKVIVAGLEQRFCQQCSRFHQLSEFDQGKRSCRRRLAGHNERRRKPPPILSSRYGSLSPFTFDNHTRTGALVMDLDAYNSALAGRDSWPNTTSGRGSGNQEATFTGKYQLPWESSYINSGPGLISSEDHCFSGVSSSDSRTSALSLLSNDQPPTTWGSSSSTTSQPPLSLGASMVQPPLGQFPCPSWGLKGNNQGGNNTLHEMPPDRMGLAQISHSASCQYTGDELGNEGQYRQLEASRGYDYSVQHMNWSL